MLDPFRGGERRPRYRLEGVVYSFSSCSRASYVIAALLTFAFLPVHLCKEQQYPIGALSFSVAADKSLIP